MALKSIILHSPSTLRFWRWLASLAERLFSGRQRRQWRRGRRRGGRCHLSTRHNAHTTPTRTHSPPPPHPYFSAFSSGAMHIFNSSRLTNCWEKLHIKKLCPLTFRVSSTHVVLRSNRCRRSLGATSTGT